MSLDQQYIRDYCDAIYTTNGKYKVHCPTCRYLLTQKKGKFKPNRRTAVLLPLKECNSKYVFHCSRCKEEGRTSGMDFLSYLFRVKPRIAERYKVDRN